MRIPIYGEVVWAYLAFGPQKCAQTRMVPALVLGADRENLSLVAVSAPGSVTFRHSVPHVSSPIPACFAAEWWLAFDDVNSLHPDAVRRMKANGEWPIGLEYVP